MRSILLALAFTAVTAAPAYADINAGTAAYLRQIGIDPASADVQSVSDDVVSNDVMQNVSLNSLATRQDATGIRKFIATRAFFHAFQRDLNAPAPPGQVYNTAYLTNPEKLYIACVIAKENGVRSDRC